MSYSGRMQRSHILSTFYAPRGRNRIYDLGIQIAQMYLSPFDKLIGVLGDSGSGKSVLIRGMFPGLELTNDDGGVNVRPLPPWAKLPLCAPTALLHCPSNSQDSSVHIQAAGEATRM